MYSIWTHVGSACVADESSAGKYRASSGRFMHKGSNTGPIYARCNVVNPRDDGRDTNWNRLEVVYRCQADGDRVTATLTRVSNETGGIHTFEPFDSNQYGKRPEEQTRHKRISHDFNFVDYAYYVEIMVDRQDRASQPSVSIVRLLFFEDFG